MQDKRKKIILITIGILVIILIGIGVGRELYYASKDKEKPDFNNNNAFIKEHLTEEKITDKHAKYTFNVGEDVNRVNNLLFNIQGHTLKFEITDDELTDYLYIDNNKYEIWGLTSDEKFTFETLGNALIYSDSATCTDIRCDKLSIIQENVVEKIYEFDNVTGLVYVNYEIKDDELQVIADRTTHNMDLVYNDEYYNIFEYLDNTSELYEKLGKDSVTSEILHYKLKNDNLDLDNPTISDKETLEGYIKYLIENIDKDFEYYGFDKIDLNAIDSTSKLNYNYSVEEFKNDSLYLNTIEKNGKGKIGSINYGNNQEKDIEILLENGKASYVFENNKIDINVPNVEKIYLQGMECASATNIYFLTTDGVAYVLPNDKIGHYYFSASTDDEKNEMLNELKTLSNSFVKVNASQKYQKLLLLSTAGPATCDYTYEILGETQNGDRYSLNYNKKFDYVNVLGYEKNIAFIKENREVEINNKIINYKLKEILSYNGNNGAYFITTDNYLYSVEDNTVIENSQIDTIYKSVIREYSEEQEVLYVVKFKNNQTYIFSGVIY